MGLKGRQEEAEHGPREGKRAPLEEGRGHRAEQRVAESLQKIQKHAAERFQAQTIPVSQAFYPSALVVLFPSSPAAQNLSCSPCTLCAHIMAFFPLMCLSCSLCFVGCTICCSFIAVSAAPREPALLGEGEAGADTVSLRGCEPCRLAPFLQFP